jgi:hypothetical protein
MLGRKFIVLNVCSRKRSQISNLSSLLKEIKKEQKSKPKPSRKKEILKTRA